MSFENVESCLKEIEDRYNTNEKVKKKLVNYDEPIQITFLDSDHSVLLLINKDQGIEIKEYFGNFRNVFPSYCDENL